MKRAGNTLRRCQPSLAPAIVLLLATSAAAAPDAVTLAGIIAQAKPGDTVVIDDGTITTDAPIEIAIAGTPEAPITIKAANRGRVVVAGKAGLLLKQAQHVVIDGLRFTHDNAHPAIRLVDCAHVRVRGCTFALNDRTHPRQNWLHITGGESHHHVIEYNLFDGKRAAGAYVAIDGSEDSPYQHSRNDRIAHNHFRGIEADGDKPRQGARAIRLGWSALAESDGETLVEFNLFEDCMGDDELITVRSSAQLIRYNTFRRCAGYVALRLGKNNAVEGNFFLGDEKPHSGGIIVFGDDARVYNNYLERLGAPALLVPNGHDGQKPGRVARPPARRAKIVHNTFVNGRANALDIGTTNAGQWKDPPSDVEIANNILISIDSELIKFRTKEATVQWAANIVYRADNQDAIGIDLSAEQAIKVLPNLTLGEEVYRLRPRSPAIAAAVDAYDFVTLDMDGQTRTGKKDIGADEFAALAIRHRPLKAEDVGPAAK